MTETQQPSRDSDPPRAARAALRLVPRQWRAEIVDALDTEWRERHDRGRDRRSWYWSQVLRSVLALLLAETRGWWGWAEARRALWRGIRDWRALAFGVVPLAAALVATILLLELIQGAWIEAMPFPRANELVAIGVRGADGALGPVSPQQVRSLTATSGDLDTVGTYYAIWQATLVEEQPALLRAVGVSPELFAVLGARAEAGRLIAPGDFADAVESVIVLDHDFWRRRFGSDRGVVGRTVRMGAEGLPFGGTITVGGDVVRIVGVAERGFRLPGYQADIYIGLNRLGMSWRDATGRSLQAIARVRTDDRSRIRELLLSRAVEPAEDPAEHFALDSLGDARLQSVRAALMLATVAVLVFLGLAGLNAATLVALSARARRRDFMIQRTLGATRARLRAIALADSGVVVGVAAAVAALASALAATTTWHAETAASLAAPERGPGAWSIALAIAVGACFLVVPALAVRRRGGAGPVRRVLVRAQIAGAGMLLVVALASVAGFVRYLGDETGVDPRRAFGFTLTLSRWNVPSGDERSEVFARLLERLRAVPGVESMALSSRLPLSVDRSHTMRFAVDDPAVGRILVRTSVTAVSPEYFETWSLRLVDGGGFGAITTTDDREIVVNERFARAYLGAGSSVGRDLSRMTADGQETGQPPFRIRGVVADVREGDGVATPRVYVHYSSFQVPRLWFVGRTEQDVMAMRASIERAVRSFDASLIVNGFRSLEDLVLEPVRLEWRLAHALAGLALLTIAMAGVGTYGVMSEVARQRRNEIGVRRAVGAEPSRILSDLLRGELPGLAMALVSSAAGGWMAMQALARVTSVALPPSLSILFGAQVLILVVAGVAAGMPYWRAARTEPAILIYGRR
ncbi:MAG: FtsX-like permease family protein [Acidobacteria bacterium]|nr:FtsX-like permease family protein [Acidobacteriota bacterium]